MNDKNMIFLRTLLVALLVSLGSLVWLNMSHINSVPIEHTLNKDVEIGSNNTVSAPCMKGDSLVLKDPKSGELYCRNYSTIAGGVKL